MFKPRDESLEVPTYSITYDYSGPFARSIEIAGHYGFRLIKPVKDLATKDLDQVFLEDEYKEACVAHVSKLAAGTPFLACHTRNPRRKVGMLALDIHGCSKSIADALGLKAALAVLHDAGEKSVEIELNSLGDNDSRARFKKHYLEFIKKQLPRIPDEYQAELRLDPYLLPRLSEGDDFLREIAQDAPFSLNYLSEHDRRHLKEVVEYIESMDVPYRINPLLLSNPDSSTQTLFRIKRTGKKCDNSVLAFGERFEHVLGIRKHPVVSFSVRMEAGKHESYKENKKPGSIKSPKIYFIHLGPEAKKKGFAVLDILRDTKVPIEQNLIRDSLTEQMIQAEKSKCEHLVIMGIKEAQENAVIVRNMETRAQTTIQIPALRAYLKTVVK